MKYKIIIHEMVVVGARRKRLPEDDVLTSEHVGANHMKLYVIKLFVLCSKSRIINNK